MAGERQEKVDCSIRLQKQMLKDHWESLQTAKRSGRKVAYTLVPGNLNELLLSLDLIPFHPEVSALQWGIRKKGTDLLREAERTGMSQDVCSYVKCDFGMRAKGTLGALGTEIPPPDVLLLSYTGCFTFVKWFELLESRYGCPIVMLHVPFADDGLACASRKEYVVRQLQENVIPALERVAGKKLDWDRLSQSLELSRRAEDDLSWVWESARRRPSPIDAWFGGVYYVAPLFTAFRGSQSCEYFYKTLREEVEERLRAGLGPSAPVGPLEEKLRLVVEGPPCWPKLRELRRIFAEWGAVVVASTYTKVGGVWDEGFRHRGSDPLGSLADYCLRCYTNLSLNRRMDLIAKAVCEYEADGFVIHSTKSCDSFSVGQPLMLGELQRRTGRVGCLIESDLIDERCYSEANIRNRLESYFELLRSLAKEK